MTKWQKLETIIGNHARKLYRLLYTERIEIDNPTDNQEAWIILQYHIFNILYNALKETNNDKRRSQKNGK